MEKQSQIQLFTLQMELAAAEALEAKSKLTSARNDVLDLEYVISKAEDNVGQLREKFVSL